MSSSGADASGSMGNVTWDPKWSDIKRLERYVPEVVMEHIVDEHGHEDIGHRMYKERLCCCSRGYIWIHPAGRVFSKLRAGIGHGDGTVEPQAESLLFGND